MKSHYISPPLSDIKRSDTLFWGDLIVFQQVTAMHNLIAFIDSMLRCHFQGLDPVTAHHYLSPDEFLVKTGKAQREIKQSEEAKNLFFAALKECGVTLEETCYDQFVLRIVAGEDRFDGGQTATIPHHRDTWGANIQCQQNWWAPIYPIEEGRSIAFYPDYWDKPLTNTTGNWNLTSYLNARKQTPAGKEVPYPSAPQATETVDEDNRTSILLSPGDMLAFSSAQLHASRINRTGLNRFSIEMRTVFIPDVLENREAPNVDNGGSTPMYSWFKRISDNKPLGQILHDPS